MQRKDDQQAQKGMTAVSFCYSIFCVYLNLLFDALLFRLRVHFFDHFIEFLGPIAVNNLLPCLLYGILRQHHNQQVAVINLSSRMR